ncbi:MAG: SDR family NAD(P)-dependent oxidoreductase, partial [Cyanobacteria bacterium P01_C01_bin.72]
MTFQGQKIIIVGGTSGIGKAVARSILKAGGIAVIVGSRQPKLDQAITELSKYGKVLGELANIADREQTKDLIERIDTNHRDATLLV